MSANELSDQDLRALWRAAGGGFHGPNIETGTMPESLLLPFLRSLRSARETDSVSLSGALPTPPVATAEPSGPPDENGWISYDGGQTWHNPALAEFAGGVVLKPRVVWSGYSRVVEPPAPTRLQWDDAAPKAIRQDECIEFKERGDFAAVNIAEAWCAERGISVGRMQGTEPRGLLRGDFDVQKWRNLDDAERAALSGVMTGDMKHGPVFVTLKASSK